MQSGLNLLSLFLMLSNTKRVKIILSLMLCRTVMLCYLNLTLKYLDWKVLRNNMCMMLNLKMCCRIVEMVEHGTSSSSMMDLCSVLTNYAVTSLNSYSKTHQSILASFIHLGFFLKSVGDRNLSYDFMCANSTQLA